MRSYNILINKHQGRRAFVVGAGTSLFELDLSPIINDVVISVNSSILKFDWQDGISDNRYWVSNDSAVRYWSYWKDVKSSMATKLIRDSWEKYFNEIPEFLVFSPRKLESNLQDEEKLCFTSSVPTAIDLAIQMGCNEIFLLGVDHYFVGRLSHFWQYWPKEKQPKPLRTILATYSMQNNIFKLNQHVYSALNEYAKSKHINIYNCSLHSRISVFEKVKYEDIVK
ncbi:MAG: hypothetical protein WDA06_00470 [Phenylobacterium sp.]